jgi:aldehyde:ferredoxin oxidoreductase
MAKQYIGGYGIGAKILFQRMKPGSDALGPDNILGFTTGPLTGTGALFSGRYTVVCKSPVTGGWNDANSGGFLGPELKKAGFDAVFIQGTSQAPVYVWINDGKVEIKDAAHLWGKDVLETEATLKGELGDSKLRAAMIGPAGERMSLISAIINDGHRAAGRGGCGAVMGSKKLKAIMIHGDASFLLPAGNDYAKVFDKVYTDMTDTDMMSKYHNLGTPGNVRLMNDLKALPIRNLQATADPATAGITGERFAEVALLRNGACAGCPVGCIHIGFVRERFEEQNRYLYRQISYDHELIFAVGSMLGVMDCFQVLKLIDVAEAMGLDVMSPGVALAWATEAFEKGMITEKETLVPLAFGNTASYLAAIEHLAHGRNEFYQLLSQSTAKAAARYGGSDFACVLGQEMGGYATGEIFFVSQALGLRHSHLDAGGYSYDQKPKGKKVEDAVKFLVQDEKARCLLNSMVSCLFARGVYTDEVLGNCLKSVGYGTLADTMDTVAADVQKLRWKMRVRSGYRPETVSIPKRFSEITTWKGQIDAAFMASLKDEYSRSILELADSGDCPAAAHD